MEIQVIKIIKDDKLYKAKDGKEYKEKNYYLKVNGKYICIRPAFHTDYEKLDFIATIIHNGASK